MMRQQNNTHNFVVDDSVIVIKILCANIDDLERVAQYVKKLPNLKFIHASRVKVSDDQRYFIFLNFVKEKL